MSRTRAQALRFLLTGLLLLAIDSGLYWLGSGLGMPIALANPLSRGVAAGCGYWLHRRLSFAVSANSAWPWRGEVLRYVVVWLLLTLLSTATLSAVADATGTEFGDAPLSSTAAFYSSPLFDPNLWAKPLVEAVLASISFLLLKHWVYRR